MMKKRWFHCDGCGNMVWSDGLCQLILCGDCNGTGASASINAYPQFCDEPYGDPLTDAAYDALVEAEYDKSLDALVKAEYCDKGLDAREQFVAVWPYPMDVSVPAYLRAQWLAGWKAELRTISINAYLDDCDWRKSSEPSIKDWIEWENCPF